MLFIIIAILITIVENNFTCVMYKICYEGDNMK